MKLTLALLLGALVAGCAAPTPAPCYDADAGWSDSYGAAIAPGAAGRCSETISCPIDCRCAVVSGAISCLCADAQPLQGACTNCNQTSCSGACSCKDFAASACSCPGG